MRRDWSQFIEHHFERAPTVLRGWARAGVPSEDDLFDFLTSLTEREPAHTLAPMLRFTFLQDARALEIDPGAPRRCT